MKHAKYVKAILDVKYNNISQRNFEVCWK